MYLSVFIALVLVTATVRQLQAQTAADSALAVVQQLFVYMKQADSNGVRSVFSADAILQTITVQQQGQTLVKNVPLQQFITAVGRMQPGDADEQILQPVVQVDDDLASVWTPYRFFYKSTFSHCGVNSFQLVRHNGAWKIHFLIDTRRKAPCN